MKGNINFMIMGDAHLGAAFPADEEKRQEEQLKAFDAAMEMVTHYNISYLFIPGDLFDERNPKKEIVEHVIRSFTSVPSANIIISCGNHDPNTIDSPYKSYRWPKNVYIFETKTLTFFEFDDNGVIAGNDYFYNNNLGSGKKGVRIYGASYEGHFSKDSMFSSAILDYPRLSSDFINVFMMHCKLDPNTNRSPYNPVLSKDVIDCGFEIAIVGDGHTQYRNEIFLNSGMLYPRGFSDLGQKGVILGDITQEGKVRTEFLPIKFATYEQLIFDVSGNNFSNIESLTSQILEVIDKSVSYEIELVGVVDYDKNISASELQNELGKTLPKVRVIDKTQKKVDLKLFSQEPIFNGIATKKVWDRVIEKRNESEGMINGSYEKSCQRALDILLKTSESLQESPEDIE